MSEEIKIKSQEISIVKTSTIKQHPKNRNKHTSEQIERLCKIISHNGFRYPLIVSNRSGLLISGHARLLCAIQLGLEHVPVIFQDFTNADEEYQQLIADNEIARWADLDIEGLINDLKEVSIGDLDLFGIEDTEKLIAKVAEESDSSTPEKPDYIRPLEISFTSIEEREELRSELIDRGFQVE